MGWCVIKGSGCADPGNSDWAANLLNSGTYYMYKLTLPIVAWASVEVSVLQSYRKHRGAHRLQFETSYEGRGYGGKERCVC